MRFHFTDRGNAANEDFAYAGELPGGGSYGVVIDGATGLAPLPPVSDGFATNAQWFAHSAGAAVCRALEAGSCAEEALRGAVAATRAELEGALGCEASRLDSAAVPSATLALAVERGSEIELWGLADSPFVALLRTGEVVVSTDKALESLDARAVDLMVERSAGRGLTGPERRALVSDVLLANRRLRNTEGGYWCLDPTGDGLEHARRLALPRADVVAVAGMSDGLFRAFGQYGMGRLDGLAGLTYCSVQRLVDRMRVLEAADPSYERFPRLKLGDDASMFWIGVNPGEES